MSNEFRPSTDALVARNADYAERRFDPGVAKTPSRQLAVVTCMDCRIDVLAMLGLKPGEAHVIRNAGGVVTDDIVRSLCMSQRALGTREIMVVQHTNCGLEGLDEHAILSELEAEVGGPIPWSVGAFDDPYDSVRSSLTLLAEAAVLPHRDHIRGFVLDVADGRLHEVG